MTLVPWIRATSGTVKFSLVALSFAWLPASPE